jgi:PKD repeat protein
MGEAVLISNRDELYVALNLARGGETFFLETGNYGSLILNGKPGFPNQFDTSVSIASSDAQHPAVFSGMALHGAHNITISGINFDYSYQSGDADYVRPFEVKNSQNITIENSVFVGDLVRGGVAQNDGFGHGYGLSVRDSTGVTIENNEFFHWGRGAIFSQSQDLLVRANDIHSIRSDGMNFAEVKDVLIEQNHLHDFKAEYGSLDHRDMIQFWTNGTNTPSENISIQQNRLDMAGGSFTQAIFMRNEAVDSQDGGEGMFYKNLSIEDNSIYNSHLHGITVGEADGLSIRGNSLIAVSDPGNDDHDQTALWIPSINVATTAKDVTITSNVTNTVNGFASQPDWQVADNTLLHPDLYDDFFISSSKSLQNGEHHFIALDHAGFRADFQQFQIENTNALANALFHVERSDQNENTKVFDAALTAKALGLSDKNIASYHWDFGDGATASGIKVLHEFSHAGVHNVTLNVDFPDGKRLVADSTVDIRGGQIIAFDSTKDAFFEYGFGGIQHGGPLASASDGALELSGNSAVAVVDHHALAGLRGADALVIDFNLQGEGTGDLFRKHLSFQAEVTKAGAVSFQLFNDQGKAAVVTSRGIWVNDGSPHDVSIRLRDGMMTLDIDGVEAAISRFSGTLPSDGDWDLSFGNPWGQRANFDGAILAFDMSAGPILPPLPSISATGVGAVEDRWDFEDLIAPLPSSEDDFVQDFMALDLAMTERSGLNALGCGQDMLSDDNLCALDLGDILASPMLDAFGM